MKKLHFIYEMKIEYTEPVKRCYFTIKCYPKATVRQRIENAKVTISPFTEYEQGQDGFRNEQLYGVVMNEHSYFTYKIEGDAFTGEGPFEEAENTNLSMIFAHPYGLNRPGDNVRAFLGRFCNYEGKDKLDTAISMMHTLFSNFKYEKCVTDVNTSAEEAIAKGSGVCQDYAHILISLLMLKGIAARYVTGLIIGEGESHAWVEILQDGKWYGLDPTNDKTVDSDYIKIGVGRDASDCQINRGLMWGGGLHTQQIYVKVSEEE